MQSGISASATLKSAFQALLSNPGQRGLLVNIDSKSETLEPGKTISAGSSFSADLDKSVVPLLADDQALFVLLRTDDDDKFVAVTYVPDRANVRQKMLVASTRLTLVRELGTEHFPTTLFATTTAELTADGWKKHEAHGNLSAPLTEEERNLVGIKEAEAQESMGTSARRGGHVKQGSLKMDAKVETALKALAAGEYGFVSLGIDMSSESLVLIDTKQASEVSPSKLSTLISPSDPRYSFYVHQPTGETVFIYTCPTASKIRERMLFAASRNSMAHTTAPEVGIKVTKSIEFTDADDVTAEAILAELAPAQTAQADDSGAGTPARQGFARPKRPGRR